MPTLVRKFDKRAQTVPPVHIVAGADESALIAAAKGGNDRAFEALAARHKRRVFGIALRFTGVRQDAEDIMQQSFQKAFLHLHQFEGRSSLSTWLTRVAINEAQMLLRKSGWKHEVSIDDSNENAEPDRPDLCSSFRQNPVKGRAADFSGSKFRCSRGHLSRHSSSQKGRVANGVGAS